MNLKDALAAAIPTTQGDRFAIAEPFVDITFIASQWAHREGAICVRGFRFDREHGGIICDSWDVEEPERMTVVFRPLAQ